MSIIRFENVQKTYGELDTALRRVSFKLHEGEFAALAGPSGSGKTTILNLALGLDQPTNGTVELLDNDLSGISNKALSELRRQKVGYVFQSYNLFPVLTAKENVEYPLAIKNIPRKERNYLADQALEAVGLESFASKFPSELSGGQQQRVAVARAIVTHPKIVFADEPTANLDSKTGKQLIELFCELNKSRNITFLFSSHDPLVLGSAQRVLEVCDGQIEKDTKK